MVPVALGLLVGWLSFYHGSTPLYASVISLVFPIVVTQLVYSGGEWTGSSSGLVGYDTLPLDLTGFFRLAGLFAVLVALCAWVFVRSDAGKLLAAVRDNDARCAYLGISPKRVSVLLTVALAGVAGLTGFLFAEASGVVAPERTPASCSAPSSSSGWRSAGAAPCWGRCWARSRSITSARRCRATSRSCGSSSSGSPSWSSSSCCPTGSPARSGAGGCGCAPRGRQPRR